jgi:hypothetical protein
MAGDMANHALRGTLSHLRFPLWSPPRYGMLSVLTWMICKTDNRTDLFQRYFNHIVAIVLLRTRWARTYIMLGYSRMARCNLRPLQLFEYYRICVILRVTETWKGSVTDYFELM